MLCSLALLPAQCKCELSVVAGRGIEAKGQVLQQITSSQQLHCFMFQRCRKRQLQVYKLEWNGRIQHVQGIYLQEPRTLGMLADKSWQWYRLMAPHSRRSSLPRLLRDEVTASSTSVCSGETGSWAGKGL